MTFQGEITFWNTQRDIENVELQKQVAAWQELGVDTLVRRFLQNEVRHEIADQSVPQGEMTHRVFLISDDDKA